MITKAQAVKLTRDDIIHVKGYKNTDGTPQRWRVNGKVKTFKTRPNDFSIPVKRGLREYGYVDQWNARDCEVA